jgi:formate-dependent nitrite reductase membrane component NrfD
MEIKRKEVINNENKNQSSRNGESSTMTTTRQGDVITASQVKEWSGQASTYYNLPLIKKAYWKWEIVLYFFFGGLAGGSFLVSTLAHLCGSKNDAPMIRTGRYIALVSIMISPLLLIKDLGRPERFLHMLRILKFRSVMSLGSWGITLFGTLCGFTAVHQMANDGLLNWFPALARLMRALPVKVIEIIGSFVGLFVAAYTGVLLSSTAVPIWGRARHILGPLFLTSGLSTALASISLILSLGRNNRNALERLERAEMVSMATELGLISALPSVLGPLGKPLFKGKIGALFGIGTIFSGLGLPLLMRLGWKLTRTPTPRVLNITTSTSVLIGGLILRYAWIVAGRASADDPHATHYYNAVENK